MDPFEKVLRQLVDKLNARLHEAVTQKDLRRTELIGDIIKDVHELSTNVLEEQRK